MAKKQAVFFVVASVADLVITLWGTARVGYAREFNPIARDILVAGGPLGLSVFKLSGVALVLVLLTWLSRDSRTWVKRAVRLLFLLGALVAGAGVWSWLPVLANIY